MELVESLRSKLDVLRPTWQCHRCGKTYRFNRRECRRCECTVFDRVR